MVDQRIDKVSKTNFELKIDITRLSAHLFTHTHSPSKKTFLLSSLFRPCANVKPQTVYPRSGSTSMGWSRFVRFIFYLHQRRSHFELDTWGRTFLDNFVNGGRVEVAWLELNTWIWRADSLQQNRFCFFVQIVRHRWFCVQVTQLRSEADKGQRPDGGFMETDINSTICVPVVQLAENTSKQHFSHNRVDKSYSPESRCRRVPLLTFFCLYSRPINIWWAQNCPE